MEKNYSETLTEVGLPIDTVSGLSFEAFNNLYFNKKPVIIKKAVLKDKSLTTWTDDYLKSLLGSRPVDVKFSKRGLYNLTSADQYGNMKMPFNEAVDLIASITGGEDSYYMQQLSIPDLLPELMNDLNIPSLNSTSDNMSAVNFWMGSVGCTTQLHFDRSHNFLVQVRGRKEMVLFAPSDTGYLYPNVEKKFEHVSQVQLNDPDLDKYPGFVNATRYYCMLEEGDLLYLTPYWWHHVTSLDTSISVNYWWNRFDVYEGAGLENLKLEEVCYVLTTFTGNGYSIDHTDETGEPLLIKAIQLNLINVVEAFLILGANPDAVSKNIMPGKTALAVALANGQNNIADVLMQYGASDN